MKFTAVTCLFVGKNGGISIRSVEPPLEEQYEIPPVPTGMRHAVQLLGLMPMVRVYKRTAEGVLPVYEEL
jgi:hypothetical protein